MENTTHTDTTSGGATEKIMQLRNHPDFVKLPTVPATRAKRLDAGPCHDATKESTTTEYKELENKTLEELQDMLLEVGWKPLRQEAQRRLRKFKGAVRDDVLEAMIAVDMLALLNKRVPPEAKKLLGFLQWLVITRTDELAEGLTPCSVELWEDPGEGNEGLTLMDLMY